MPYNTVHVVYLVVILIWWLGKSRKDCHINCTPFLSHLILQAQYSTEIHQFKIQPIALFDQIAKYLTIIPLIQYVIIKI